MNRRLSYLGLGAILTLGMLLARDANSCPFCTSVAQTFSEEFATVDAIVIAQLEQLPPPSNEVPDPTQPPPSAKFTIVEVLKGREAVGSLKELTTVFFGEGKQGDKYLITGVDPKDLFWSTPLKIEARQHQYILDLMKLPEDGATRLEFFQRFLEDTDKILSQDAYDEFARAPYATVKQLKAKMDHDQLIKWIHDKQIPASRKRLYFTMLGVCGGKDDLPFLEQRLRSNEPEAKSGLDALIACYLTLSGADGLPLVEELFFKKPKQFTTDNYADVYAAIMALRFHGTEGDVLTRPRILQAFTLLFDNIQMADLVIPDFARWEDWTHLDRFTAMYKSEEAKSAYVRMPIVRYALACPLPEAKKALEVFQEVDPGAYKRALTSMPQPPAETAPAPAKAG